MTFLKMLLTLFVVIGVFHMTFYFFTSGKLGGVSGFVSEGTEDEGGSGLPLLFSPATDRMSRIILVAEWAIILFFGGFFYVRKKLETKREVSELNTMKKGIKVLPTGTDIDNLYAVLKVKKRVTLPNAAKVYGVSEEVMMNWAKALESGGLAVVDYPRFGEPELVYKVQKPNMDKNH